MGSVEQRSRELLAAAYDRCGLRGSYYIANPDSPKPDVTDEPEYMVVEAACSAIAAALREQPEARGVVETNKTRITLHQDRAGCEWIIVTNADYPDFESEVTPDDDPALFAFLKDLTAAQQPVQEGGGEVCDCENPEPASGAALVSMECPVHNDRPRTAPPSAPVGVEALAWLVMYGNRVTGWTNEATKDLILLTEGERLVPVAEITRQPAQAAPGDASFQSRVSPWMLDCFGAEIADDQRERGDRLLEETLELLQSHGYDPARVATLTGYVYGRPVGEPEQEVGGVMVTLAAYCRAARIDMHEAGERELARILQPAIIDKIRRKQESKRGLHTPLPTPPGDDAAGGGS